MSGRGRGGDRGGGGFRGGDRGGGGFRGRGGGGRGRGGGAPSEPVRVFRDPVNPYTDPDATITSIENDYMKHINGPEALAKLSLNGHFPARPGYGTQGKKIVVYTNYHRITVPKSCTVTRYNVEVSPKTTGRKLARVLELFFARPEIAGAVLATEFKSLVVTSKPLEMPMPYEVDVVYMMEGETTPPAKPTTYSVRLVTPTHLDIAELVNHLASRVPGPLRQSMAPQLEIIQGLNTLLGFPAQSNRSVVSLARNRHYSVQPRDSYQLGGGLEALRGFYQSVRAASGGLLLNVNVVHNVFLEPIKLDILMQRLGTGNMTTLQKKLKRIRVELLHLPPKTGKGGVKFPRVKTCYALAHPGDGQKSEKPPQVASSGAGPKGVKFWLAERPGVAKKPGGLPTNQYVTVYDYFRKTYPQLQINERVPVVNVGNSDNPNYLPADVCVIAAGQTIERRLSPEQTAEMIKFACRKPYDNADSIICDGKKVLALSGNSTFNNFGISVGQPLMTVHARVLAPPVIKYKNPQNKEHSLNPRFGSWNLADIKFHIGSNLGGWTYMHIKGSRFQDRFSPTDLYNTVGRFASFLTKSGVNAGGFIRDKSPMTLALQDGDERGNDKLIKAVFRKFRDSPVKPRFCLVILPYAETAMYNSIKTSADLKAGVHTVCVVGSKFMKEQRQEQYFGNISLKFNLKAGGINQVLDPSKLGIISEGKTMVVGIDVTHPSPGSAENAPSIAAIVASVDKHLGQWPGDFQRQDVARDEMVSSLEHLLMGRLRAWQKKNARLPENIIIYRDGVSEGQYQLLLDKELPLIRNACRQMYPGDATKGGWPKISIIVCGKRHHTRFFPVSEANADRSANCEPGTCVDRGITETRVWDFFLQPHACLQGTARPCHYVVILDEIFGKQRPRPGLQNPADTLEDLTHNMCYLFPRATKAVSLCPPAYLADLLCTRARCYLSEFYEPNDSLTTTSAAPSSSSGSTEVSDLRIPENLRDSMWYI